MRYFNERNEIKIMLQDNSFVQGNLIWADSSYIIIDPTNIKFDWKNAKD